MKMNIKGLVFVGFAAAVFASAANAAIPEGDAAKKAVTSVSFTENTYQKKLTPGNFVSIDNSGNITTTYSEGNGINISETGAISVDESDLTRYKEGDNVTFGTPDANGVIPINATDTTYGAFNGTANGLVPATGAAAGKVLSGDGSWIEVDGTEYTAGSHVADITNHQINVEGDGAVASGNNKLVTGGTVYTAVDARVPKQIGAAADEGKVLTVDNQGQVTLSAADTYQKKLTPGNFVSIDNNGNITTTYSAGTNVSISNTGQISADDTTYTADNTTVEIDAANNNQIKAKTGAITTGDETTLTTGAQVATYVSGLLAGTIPAATGCSTTAPCALVATGANAFAWEPIQQ